jgi:hypothetical protein
MFVIDSTILKTEQRTSRTSDKDPMIVNVIVLKRIAEVEVIDTIATATWGPFEGHRDGII